MLKQISITFAVAAVCSLFAFKAGVKHTENFYNIDNLFEVNKSKSELIKHYDNICNHIIACDNKYDWADKYGDDEYCAIFDEMDILDSLYSNMSE